MRAYLYDNLEGDQRLPHDSHHSISASALNSLGVFTTHIPPSDINTLENLATERCYKNRDEITVSPSVMGELYPSKVKMFFEEHLHEDEEIRWVLDGEGYFDVRDDKGVVGDQEGKGKWIRIKVEKGDLLVLPAGVYHRFTTAEGDYIKAMRLFKDEPKWTPLNRSEEVDANPHRKQYLESLAQGVTAA